MTNLPTIVRAPKDPAKDLSAIADRQTQLAIVNNYQNRMIRNGWIVFFMFFVGLVGWAAFMPLSGAIIAQGELVAQGDNKPVQHYGGGIIKEILVSSGDLVQKGDVLLRLDETSSSASAEVTQHRYLAAKAQEARLLAEQDKRDSIQFPEELSSLPAEEAAEIRSSQQKVFDARRQTFLGQTKIMQERIIQLKQEIMGQQAQLAGTRQQLVLINDEAETVRQLVAEGLAVKSRLLALQRSQASLRGQIGALEAQIARSQQSIGETELQIESLRDRIYSSVVEELKNTQNMLSELRQQRKVTTFANNQAEVRAPITGYVQELKVSSEGQVIGNGTVLMEIVPTDQPMVASIKIKPSDIDEVSVGQKAEIKLSIYDMRTFNKPIDGEVSFIAADRSDPSSYADQRLFPQGFYGGKITINMDQISEYQKTDNIRLFPGAPAMVIIPTVSRTALEYFLGPIMTGVDQAFREK